MLARVLADQFYRRLEKLEHGTLKLTSPDGKTRIFKGSNTGESVTMEIYRWSVIKNMIRKGDIGLAEDYRAGHWETNDLTALTTLGLVNRNALEKLVSGNQLNRALANISYIFKRNSVRGSRKNIHEHYDLGNAFYQLWLDPTMTYSSALFLRSDETLQKAQFNKYDRILGCLGKDSGSILEIGCGWGGFAARACDRGDFKIKGITLSDEQHRFAKDRLGPKAEIALEDYRHQTRKFDSIVSIEMFEAVGEQYWKTYFHKLRDLLDRNGKAVIQTITMNEEDFPHYRRGGDFIRSYIFPGGMLPSPSRFEKEASTAGMKTENPHFFGKDYATTLEHWLQRFDRKRDQVLALGFDEPFIRLWRFYLASCIAGFRTERTNVMQVELSHA